MNKVAIFPYDYKFAPVIEAMDLLGDKICINKVFSFGSWGYVGKRLSLPLAETEKKIFVEDLFEKVDTTKFDTFMLIDSEHNLDEKYLYQVIEDMSMLQKDIWILKRLEAKQLEVIKAICNKNRTNIRLLVQSDNAWLSKDEEEILYDINIPIIAVAGVGENTNKMKIQLGINRELKNDEYKAFWISSRDEAVLYDGQHFPEFMFSEGISEKKKILTFNHYIKWIEEAVKPDIILIGIPGGIMPDSKKQIGNLGITAFEILNSVNPDYFILSLYSDDINEKYLKELCNITKYKLNAEIDAFFVSEMAQDAYSLNKISPVEYIHLGSGKVDEIVKKLQNKDTNVYSKSTMKSLYKNIIEKLAEYGEYQAL